MQLKLLNFHKFLANFATNLVGAFIPLIIYKATSSIYLAIGYLLLQCLSRLICNHIFKNLYVKYPQLFLVLRVVPLLIYNIFLLFIEDQMVLSLILITICYGMNLSFKNNAQEILFNYTSGQKKSDKNLAKTRILDCISLVISSLSGGLFLDFNATALIIISIVLYLISVIPIFIYFITHRNQNGFNKDYVSNAVLEYEKDDEMSKKSTKITKLVVINYFILYMIFCGVDNFTSFHTLHMFIQNPTFTKAGYITAIFNFAKMIGLFSVEFINRKLDLNKTISVISVALGLTLVGIPFISSSIVNYLLYFVFGFTYEVLSYFMMQALMAKSRIIGATNASLLARQDGIMVGQMLSSLSIIVTGGNIIVSFFFMLAMMVIFAIYMPVSEEKLRKKLVNYLQNNEIED